MTSLTTHRRGFFKIDIKLDLQGEKPVTICGVSKYPFLGKFFKKIGYASQLSVFKDGEVKTYYVNTKSFLKHVQIERRKKNTTPTKLKAKQYKVINYLKIKEIFHCSILPIDATQPPSTQVIPSKIKRSDEEADEYIKAIQQNTESEDVLQQSVEVLDCLKKETLKSDSFDKLLASVSIEKPELGGMGRGINHGCPQDEIPPQEIKDGNKTWAGTWKNGVFTDGKITDHQPYVSGDLEILKRETVISNQKIVEDIFFLSSGKIKRSYNEWDCAEFEEYFDEQDQRLTSHRYRYIKNPVNAGPPVKIAGIEKGTFDENHELQGSGVRFDVLKDTIFIGNFEHGVMDGLFAAYNKQSQLITLCTFVKGSMQETPLKIGFFAADGKMHGMGVIIIQDGTKLTGTFDHGVLHGEFIIEIPGKKQIHQGRFEHNEKVGTWTIVQNDTLIAKGTYIADKREGVWDVLTSDGMEKIVYQQGIEIDPKVIDEEK